MTDSDTRSSRQHEAQLIARARCDDREALRELVDLHKDRLFAFIWRMARNHHDAEEICQDAFLKAFASLDSFCTDYRFSTWLFTIGYRICLNRMRRRRMVTGELEWIAIPARGEDAAPAALESEDAAQLKERVWEAVDRLTAPQRATVLLFYRHDMGCREIGQVLELPVATIKSHLHRARKRLRETLESVRQADWEGFRNRAGSAG